MNNCESHIRLDRVLEFAIFSNTPIYVYPTGSPNQKAIFNPEEVFDDRFIAQLATDSPIVNPTTLFKDKDLTITMGYKRQSLVFSARLAEFPNPTQPDNHYVFSRPEIGRLINQRENPRVALNDLGPSLKAVLKVLNHTGERTFETRSLMDISQAAISLFLDRTTGLVLPGDLVSELQVFYNDVLVIATSGQIARIDKKRTSRSIENGYFAVVQFDHRPEIERISPEQERRRKIERVCMLGEGSGYIESKHPLLQQHKVQGQIVDISTSGISFVVKKTHNPIIPGTVFNEIFIELPFQPKLKASCRVAYCQNIANNETYCYRIGAEFIGLSVELIKAISQTVQRQFDKRLVDASSEDYDQLWEFFFETGFIYHQKRKQLQQSVEKMLNTYKRLLQNDTPILKKIIFKEDNEIRGHVSTVRFFDRAWIIQHLNAIKATDSSAAQAVLKGVVNFFFDWKANRDVDTRYVTCFYRPNNLYPSLLFGEARSIIANPAICDSIDLDFCLLKDEIEATLEDPSLEAREANESDLDSLENLLIEQNYHNELRIEGLDRDNILNLRIASEYEKLELYRYRRVFVARSENGPEAAFAVCNYGSPGLNLSELTNSFRLYFSAPKAESNSILAQSVSNLVIQSYRETEMPSMVLLAEQNQIIPVQFNRAKVYTYWHYNADHIDQYVRASEMIFSNFKEILRKRKLNEQTSKTAA